MLSAIDDFYEKLEEPIKGCMLALKTLILDYDPSIELGWKYSLPFFCIKNKNVCYIWIDKKTKHPYVGFLKGHLVDHPALIQGDRKLVKVLNIHPEKDIPVQELYEVLSLVLPFYNK